MSFFDFFKKPKIKEIILENTFIPTASYKPRPIEIKISNEAKEAAKQIKLPNIKAGLRKSEEWIAAFKWYNSHVNERTHPLRMTCQPCWTKVYIALKKAKGVV